MGTRPDAEEFSDPIKLEPAQPATATPPTPEQARALAVQETRSGPGSPSSDAAILERQRRQVSRDADMRYSQKVPTWLRALAEKKASDDEVIRALEKRLRRAPTHENLLLLKAFCHDLTRKPGGTERLKQVLTQDLVNAITQKGG